MYITEYLQPFKTKNPTPFSATWNKDEFCRSFQEIESVWLLKSHVLTWGNDVYWLTYVSVFVMLAEEVDNL